MQVIHVPLRLRFWIVVTTLSIPMALFEVILISRSPWWNLPYRVLLNWLIIFLFICLPLMRWLIQSKRWVIPFIIFLSVIWISFSAGMAMQLHSPQLSFFTVALLLGLATYVVGLIFEMDRSFYNPQMSWYQSLPQSIPWLLGRVEVLGQLVSVQVSRLDSEGAFVFFPAHVKKPDVSFLTLPKGTKVRLRMQYRTHSITCTGIPAVALKSGKGLGMKFVELSPDHRKELGDFVDLVALECKG